MPLSAKIAAVDITENAVRIAVVQTGRQPKLLDHVYIEAIHPEDSDPDESLLVAVRRAADALSVKPTLFVLAARSEWGVVRLLRIPFRGRRRVGAAVPFELEPLLAFPIEDLLIDHRIVRDVDGQTEALVFGVRRAELERRLDVLDRAGIVIEGIGLDAIGLTTLWESGRGKSTGSHCAVHVRRSEALLTVVNRNTLGYIHRLPLSNEQINTDPAGFARTVRNALHSYANAAPGAPQPESITVTGADFMEAGRTIFDDELEVPVDHQNLEASYPALQNEDTPSPPNAWASLIGVASAAAGGKYNMNFLDSARESLGDRRDIVSRAVVACVLMAGALVAYLILAALDYRNNQRDMENIGQEIWGIYAELYPDKPNAKERPGDDRGGATSSDLLNAEIEYEIEDADVISLNEFGGPTFIDILHEISKHCPESKVTITNIGFKTRGRRQVMLISGEVPDQTQYDSVIDGLASSPLFSVDTQKVERKIVEGLYSFVVPVEL